MGQESGHMLEGTCEGGKNVASTPLEVVSMEFVKYKDTLGWESRVLIKGTPVGRLFLW